MSNRGKLYSVDGEGQLVRKNEFCPKCAKGVKDGATGGVFMARHADRSSCGRCGWTEWNPGSAPPPVVQTDAPAEEPAEEPPAGEPAEAPGEEPAEVEAEAPSEAPVEEPAEAPPEGAVEEAADPEE